jgi:negative regulator of sigma E activity
MADERDPQVSRRYRELGAEEPPRALDQAILAAGRKAVARKRSWYGPVAIAAALTLAVAVTVQVERRKPEELVASAPPPPLKEEAAPQERKQQAFKAPEQPRPAAKPPTPEPPRAATAPQRAEAPPELAKSNEEARARGDAARDSVAAAPAPAPGARAMGQMQSKVEAPEAWLERIAALRKDGKHEEADKALAEFGKRYPDYRISDEMRAKVEKK